MILKITILLIVIGDGINQLFASKGSLLDALENLPKPADDEGLFIKDFPDEPEDSDGNTRKYEDFPDEPEDSDGNTWEYGFASVNITGNKVQITLDKGIFALLCLLVSDIFLVLLVRLLCHCVSRFRGNGSASKKKNENSPTMEGGSTDTQEKNVQEMPTADLVEQSVKPSLKNYYTEMLLSTLYKRAKGCDFCVSFEKNRKRNFTYTELFDEILVDHDRVQLIGNQFDGPPILFQLILYEWLNGKIQSGPLPIYFDVKEEYIQSALRKLLPGTTDEEVKDILKIPCLVLLDGSNRSAGSESTLKVADTLHNQFKASSNIKIWVVLSGKKLEKPFITVEEPSNLAKSLIS